MMSKILNCLFPILMGFSQFTKSGYRGPDVYARVSAINQKRCDLNFATAAAWESRAYSYTLVMHESRDPPIIASAYTGEPLEVD